MSTVINIEVVDNGYLVRKSDGRELKSFVTFEEDELTEIVLALLAEDEVED